MKPRNPLELDLVCRAVRLAGGSIAPSGSGRPTWPTASEWPRSGAGDGQRGRLSRVHDLGSKLFFKAGIGPGYSSATADDYPAVIVHGSKETPKVAAGCSLAGPKY